jgi:hypothetical protein
MKRESVSEIPGESRSAEKRKPPQPTYAPFMLAIGVTMVFWGLATSPVMSAAGFVALAWALWTWITEIANDWRS